MTNFADLGLGENVLKAVLERGYTQATPIQAEAIPNILMMRDLIGLAQTGTGKTASFTLPMIEILFTGSRPVAHAALAGFNANTRTRGASC